MVEVLDKVGEYVTLREAARSLNVKPNTLYKWMCREKKSFRMIGRTLLIRPSEVADYTSGR